MTARLQFAERATCASTVAHRPWVRQRTDGPGFPG